MELLERERFLVELDTALKQVAAGHGRAVLVTGEAGIGKTALVEHFASRHRQAARVLWGVCDALFTPRPLGPLHDVAHQSRTDLLTLLNKRAPRTSIFSTFLDDLQAGTRPTIVVFEDIHWADEATLDLIKFVGRRIHRTRALLIMTYRDDEVATNHPLRLMVGDLPTALVTRLHLPPLSEAAVEAMAQRARRPSERLHALTAGNPFFITEVLAAVAPGVPGTVRDAVLARVARLSPPASGLLELVSVAPTRLERWVLDAAFAPGPAVLDECTSAGMLRVEDTTVAFRHELARRAVEDALPPARQQHLHGLVLQAMVERGPEAVQVARLVHHASGARDGEAVLRFAPVAARQAASLGAHREAAAHFAASLRYADGLLPEVHVMLLEGQSFEYYLTNQLETALETRSAALRIWHTLGHQEKEGETLRWLSRLSWISGRRAEAESFAVKALEVLEGLPPGRELAMAYSNRAQLHMLAEENDEAVHWGARAIELARTLNDHEILSHALNNVGTAQYWSDQEQGRAELEQSLQLALEHSLEEHAARAYNNLVAAHIRYRDYSRALVYLREGIPYCSERDLDVWALQMRVHRAELRLQVGEWTEAADEAEAVLAKVANSPASRVHALVVLGLIRARRGDPEAEQVLDKARLPAQGMAELQRIGTVAAACAEAAWLRGDSAACVAAARPAWELALARQNIWFKGELSFWMWRGGGLKEPPTGIATPYALQMAGDWQGAAVEWHRIGCPYERAWALADGDEAALRAALSIFEQLGATPGAEIVRRRLRAQGVRDIPRGARASTRRNPAGLTDREAEVLRLVGEGLQTAQIASRLFVSPKTVENHISAIMAKLNVHTRAEAVAAAYQLGVVARRSES